MFQRFLAIENQSMEKVDQKCVDPIECGFFEVWNFKTFWISSAKTGSVCFKDFWLLKINPWKKSIKNVLTQLNVDFLKFGILRPFGFLLQKLVQCVSKISGF